MRFSLLPSYLSFYSCHPFWTVSTFQGRRLHLIRCSLSRTLHSAPTLIVLLIKEMNECRQYKVQLIYILVRIHYEWTLWPWASPITFPGFSFPTGMSTWKERCFQFWNPMIPILDWPSIWPDFQPQEQRRQGRVLLLLLGRASPFLGHHWQLSLFKAWPFSPGSRHIWHQCFWLYIKMKILL